MTGEGVPLNRRRMMQGYSVTITMTPRQAVEAERALHRYAVEHGSPRAFTAAHRIMYGLLDAGWKWAAEGESWVHE